MQFPQLPSDPDLSRVGYGTLLPSLRRELGFEVWVVSVTFSSVAKSL